MEMLATALYSNNGSVELIIIEPINGLDPRFIY